MFDLAGTVCRMRIYLDTFVRDRPDARPRDETPTPNPYPILSSARAFDDSSRRLAALLCCAAAACTSRETPGWRVRAPESIRPRRRSRRQACSSTSRISRPIPWKDARRELLVKRRPSPTCSRSSRRSDSSRVIPDGTYLQNVDLIGYNAHPTASFSAGGKTVALAYPATSSRTRATTGRRRRSTNRTSCSSDTASSRRNMVGTTTRAST